MDYSVLHLWRKLHPPACYIILYLMEVAGMMPVDHVPLPLTDAVILSHAHPLSSGDGTIIIIDVP